MTIRFGLLGTGYWAETVHAASLAAHPDVEFVGVWGRDAAKAALVAERHRAVAEPNLEELLGKVDAVAIALSPDVQAELACQAADAGCHLLLEKPLALSVAAADRLVSATERAGVASLVAACSPTRIEPTASWFREIIAGAEWHGGNVTLLASPFAPGSPFGQSPWRRKHGALWDAGPHALALLLPALGAVEDVLAEPGLGDTVHLALGHQAGGVSSTTLSLTLPESTAGSHLRIEFWGPSVVVGPPALAAGRLTDAVKDASALAISELLAAVQTGVPHESDVHFAAEIVGILDAAERFLARPSKGRGERPQLGAAKKPG